MSSSVTIPFELSQLKNAVNYQKWVIEAVTPHLGSSILEIGAGIGNMSQRLPLKEKLILTEADPQLFELLKKQVDATFGYNDKIQSKLIDVSENWTEQFKNENLDTVVSFNVLEHIEDDLSVMRQCYELLKSSKSKNEKKIVTFVPAHQWSYGEMDKVFKHHRRYNHDRLIQIAQQIDPLIKINYRYFNLLGLPPWFLFGKILKRNKIDQNSVKIFEKLCPYTKGIDDFIHTHLKLPLGQSLLFVMSF